MQKITTNLDALLKPLGFERKGSIWSCHDAPFTSVVSLQESKAGDSVTLNAGMLDEDVYEILWAELPPRPINEAACTVRARIGQLLDDLDKWWELDDPTAAQSLQAAVQLNILPWLKRMRSKENMAEWLAEPKMAKFNYPLSTIHLSILRSLMGNQERACELLADLKSKKIGAWSDRVEEVRRRLNCP